jgi:hypothetical protein
MAVGISHERTGDRRSAERQNLSSSDPLSHGLEVANGSSKGFQGR